MKKFNFNIFLLLPIALCFISCKKDSQTRRENSLIGTWVETNLSSANSSITFAKNKSFNLSTVYNVGAKTSISGTYQVEGDRLKMNANERSDQQPGMDVVKRPASGEVFEAATFSISGNIMTLKHISYPADAPYVMTSRFKKE